MTGNNDIPLIEYQIIDVGVYEIFCKMQGDIGHITYNTKNKLWVFLPKQHFFYQGLHLALILKKLNELNEYHKRDDKK